jgi:hypothetical protein
MAPWNRIANAKDPERPALPEIVRDTTPKILFSETFLRSPRPQGAEPFQKNSSRRTVNLPSAPN